MKVDVYWNATKKLFSIRMGGKVVGHAKHVLIREGSFVVRPSGRDRVRRTGKKEVHAFVRGRLEAWKGETTYTAPSHVYPLWTKEDTAYRQYAQDQGLPLRYNPMRDDNFMALDSFGHWEPAKVSSGMTYLCIREGRPAMFDFDPCLMAVVA